MLNTAPRLFHQGLSLVKTLAEPPDTGTATNLLRASSDAARLAEKLGYFSSSHLANQFRRTYGVTASEWRRQRLEPPRQRRKK